MAPFEALYWNQTRESQVFGPEILQEAESKYRLSD
jgi:hypothetical protein